MVIPASNILGKDIDLISQDELIAGLKVCIFAQIPSSSVLYQHDSPLL